MRPTLGDVVLRRPLRAPLRATPRSSSPKATLRITVAHGISAKSWNTKARSGPGPGDHACHRPAPRRRVAGSRPAMILSSVVLPQPDGPSSVVSCPAGKSSVMSLERLDAAGIGLRDVADLDHRRGAAAPAWSRGCGGASWRCALLRSEQTRPRSARAASMNSTEKTMIEKIAAYILRIVRDRLVVGDEVADAGRA